MVERIEISGIYNLLDTGFEQTQTSSHCKVTAVLFTDWGVVKSLNAIDVDNCPAISR